MIGGLFASIVLALFAVVVIVHAGMIGFALFGLAFITAMSGLSQ